MPVAPERVDWVDTKYQAVLDVTSLVQGAGGGWWTVGGVQAGTGEGVYAGWALVVTYEDAAAPVRSLVVLDGLSEVSPSSSTSFEVGGFMVPSTGSASATLTALSWEGDAGLIGDQLSMDGVDVADADNPLGNTFNSSVSDLGIPVVGRLLADANLFGMDLDRFDVTGLLAPGTTSATIELATDADRFLSDVKVAKTADRTHPVNFRTFLLKTSA